MADVIGQISDIPLGFRGINIDLDVRRVVSEVGSTVFQSLQIGLRLLGMESNVNICGAFPKAADLSGQVQDALLGRGGIRVNDDFCAVSARLKTPDVTRQTADILGRLFGIGGDVDITLSLGSQPAKHTREVADPLLGLHSGGAYGYAIR